MSPRYEGKPKFTGALVVGVGDVQADVACGLTDDVGDSVLGIMSLEKALGDVWSEDGFAM
jgi:hypothetical protein